MNQYRVETRFHDDPDQSWKPVNDTIHSDFEAARDQWHEILRAEKDNFKNGIIVRDACQALRAAARFERIPKTEYRVAVCELPQWRSAESIR